MAQFQIGAVSIDTEAMNLKATSLQEGYTGESRGYEVPADTDLYAKLKQYIAEPEWALGMGSELITKDGETVGRVTKKFSDAGDIVAIMTNFDCIARPNSAKGLIIYPTKIAYKLSNATPGIAGAASLSAVKALRTQLTQAIDGFSKNYNANGAVAKLLNKSVSDVEAAIKAASMVELG